MWGRTRRAALLVQGVVVAAAKLHRDPPLPLGPPLGRREGAPAQPVLPGHEAGVSKCLLTWLKG